jgi:hypothetical protein
MKTISSFSHTALAVTLPLTLLLSATSSQAQPRKPGNQKGAAIKHAQAVLGKPLTPVQKKAVRAAQKERQEAIKPIQEKFKAKVAKALGFTVDQYEERENALRQKNKAVQAR